MTASLTRTKLLNIARIEETPTQAEPVEHVFVEHPFNDGSGIALALTEFHELKDSELKRQSYRRLFAQVIDEMLSDEFAALIAKKVNASVDLTGCVTVLKVRSAHNIQHPAGNADIKPTVVAAVLTLNPPNDHGGGKLCFLQPQDAKANELAKVRSLGSLSIFNGPALHPVRIGNAGQLTVEISWVVRRRYPPSLAISAPEFDEQPARLEEAECRQDENSLSTPPQIHRKLRSTSSFFRLFGQRSEYEG